MTRANWLPLSLVFILSVAVAFVVRTCLSCWVGWLVQLLDQHSTFALVVVTGAYVWLTWKLLLSQREPALAVYLTPSERWPNTIDVVIKNWGGGPAIDVRWTLEGNQQTRTRYQRLFTLDLFQRVSNFPPGQQIRSFLGTGPDLLEVPVPPAVTVTVTYRGHLGGRRRETFILDVMLLANLAPYTTPEADMAEHLKGIKRATEDIAQSLRAADKLNRVKDAIEDMT